MSEFSVTCTKDNLMQGLTRVTAVAGRNTQLPILSHVLLQSRNGSLHLTATDLEVGVHTLIGGRADGEGAVTIPARGFFSYIGQLPPGNPITVRITDRSVHVKTTGFAAQFPMGNADDFPLLPKGKKDGAIALPGDRFCQALEQVLFASAREETRPEIRGVYVHIQDRTIRLAATDSFRLAEEVESYNGTGAASFTLPLPSAQEITRLFSGQEKLSLALQDSHILFFSDEIDVTSRLVDGTYPDYQQIIPRGAKTTLRISREDVLQALKTLVVFLPRDSRRVELEVKVKKGVMRAQVVGDGAGEGRVDIPVDASGEDVVVLVNIQYLLEGLQHLKGDDCVIELGGATNPLVMRPDAKDLRYVYVVMPIRA